MYWLDMGWLRMEYIALSWKVSLVLSNPSCLEEGRRRRVWLRVDDVWFDWFEELYGAIRGVELSDV